MGPTIRYALLCPLGTCALGVEARVEPYALKDSDPLRAKARVESYASTTPLYRKP